MNKLEKLQNDFEKGSTPKNLDGFYKGTLEEVIPRNLIEHFSRLVSKFYVPWLGKNFNKKDSTGNNIIPKYLSSFLWGKYWERVIVKSDDGKLHAIPFKTFEAKGLKDNIKVLRLDYDLPQNPGKVRKIIDELVKVGENYYLGKIYIKKADDYLFKGFFSLKK